MKFEISKTRRPVIVTESGAPEPVRFAAGELAEYLGRVLGVNTLVSSETATGGLTLTVEIVHNEDLGDEGHELISETGDRFRIRGGGSAGAVFGVYDFLRRYCGCLFSGCGKDSEHVPVLNKIEIPFGCVRMKPQLWYRGLQFSNKTQPEDMIEQIDWMAKNGMNYVMFKPLLVMDADAEASAIDPATGEIRFRDSYSMDWFRENILPEVTKRGLKLDMNHHNFLAWLPPSKYFGPHSEWYSEVDGERSSKPAQLCVCTSNRDAVAVMISNIRCFLDENPEVSMVGVIPEDGFGMCQCADCRAMDYDEKDAFAEPANFRDPGERMKSRSKVRRYVRLLNEVAREIAQSHPKVKVSGAFYVDILWPPEDVEVESNIVPWIATYWRCAAHVIDDGSCEINSMYMDVIKEWRSRHAKGDVILYEYYMGMNAQRALPYPMGANICREWPKYKAMGVHGATVQSFPANRHIYGLNYLAFARNGWEGNVEYEQLREEYLRGMFGAAAHALLPIYEGLDNAVMFVEAGGAGNEPALKCIPPAKGHLLPNGLNVIFFLNSIGEKIIDDCIRAAELSAETGRERRQVAQFREAVEYWRRGYDVMQLRLKAVASSHDQNIDVELIRAMKRWQAQWARIRNNGWAHRTDFLKGELKKLAHE